MRNRRCASTAARRQVYLREIGDLLLRMPRPLLLLLKTNDCLRSVDNALGSPLNTVRAAPRCAWARPSLRDRASRPGVGPAAAPAAADSYQGMRICAGVSS